MEQATGGLLSIFVSYDARDREWCTEIKRRVRRLVREGVAGDVRFTDEILAGQDEVSARRAGLEQAHLILLLVSSDFLDNEQCWQEAQRALARQAQGSGVVVPIVVRAVDWAHTPFAALRALPPGQPPRPLKSWPDRDQGWLAVEQGLRDLLATLRGAAGGPPRLTLGQVRELRDMYSDHSAWLQKGGRDFVGRERELSEVRERLAALRATGGYLLISAQAGQGKSSLIARLVLEQGEERAVYHFIRALPPPEQDYQVTLLRDLLARLILVCSLEPGPLFSAGTSRPALSNACRRLLRSLGERGEAPVIFIDGLDQLPPEANGERDLSFLPEQLPPGVVVVLGTRPDATLRQLRRLQPQQEYQLPPLSSADFLRLLEQRGLRLERLQAEQLYRSIEANTLYQALAVQELQRSPALQPAALVRRLADDPGAIFSIAVERLKRLSLWEPVICPILGLLLAAREPLAEGHLRRLLAVPDYKCRDGLQHLSGLLLADGRQRYSLYHLKFRDYLCQDQRRPEKDYLFAVDELAHWHRLLADWCEQGGEEIWQEAHGDPLEEERRRYARQHLAAHLYEARAWERLFALLDGGLYGQQKIRLLDASTRAYAHDLDLGRRAVLAASRSFAEGLALLPRLWAYTLLRCSLSSQADRYPPPAFALLVQLGRAQEALGLADLLSDVASKVEALVAIARQRQAEGEEKEAGLLLYLRACELARQSEEPERLAPLLCELGRELQAADLPEPALLLWRTAAGLAGSISEPLLRQDTQGLLAQALCEAGQWGEVEELVLALPAAERTAETMLALLAAYAHTGRWRQAEELMRALPERTARAEALIVLADALASASRWEEARQRWRDAEELIASLTPVREQARLLVRLAAGLARAQEWSEAERVAALIADEWQRDEALLTLVQEEARAQRWQEAGRLCTSIEDGIRQGEALTALVAALARAGRWQEAGELSRQISESRWRLEALTILGRALAQAGQGAQAEGCWREAERECAALSGRPRMEALLALGRALAQAGQNSRATRCWREAETIIRARPADEDEARALATLARALIVAAAWEEAAAVIDAIATPDQRARTLLALGRALARAGAGARAEGCWQEAERLLLTLPAAAARAEILKELEEGLIEAGRWQEAERVARLVPLEEGRGDALAALAGALTRQGLEERAAPLWQEAEHLVEQLASDWERADALLALVREQARAARWSEAERLAQRIPRAWERADALVVLATELARAGQWERAEQLADSVGLESAPQRAEILLALGEALARAGQSERAVQLLEQGLQAIYCVEEAPWRAEKLAELGRLLAGLGRRQQARALWQECERLIEAMPGMGSQSHALEKLAEALILAHEERQAARLIAAIPGAWERARAQALLEQAGRSARAAPEGALPEPYRELSARFSERETARSRDEAEQQQLASMPPWEEVPAWQEAQAWRLRLVQEEWSRVGTREEALQRFALVSGLVGAHPELGRRLLAAFGWVERFLRGEGI
jgi:hypothetical protein